VDHDHKAATGHGHDPARGCPLCIRGILCRPCNDMLGHVRDDVLTLYRALRYLQEWPAASAGI
jgi:hypothetical protein